MWKYLSHPNIVPFKGITLEPPQLVSEWMPGGPLNTYIQKNRANLTNLVGPFLLAYKHNLTVFSYSALLKVLIISTRAT